MTGEARLTVDGPLARIGFLNPNQGVMDRAMEMQLLAAVEKIEADPKIRVAILVGEGPGVFIRHYDLAPLAEQSAELIARGLSFSEDRPVREAPIHVALRRIAEGRVIYVAALNGTAMGGGFELALACDVRLVQAGPWRFGLPEVNLGILPGAGGTQRLQRLIGPARALALLLLGDTIGPEEMVALGLALEIADDVEARARALAERLLRKPPRALAHIKALVQRAAAVDPALLAAERTLFCDLLVTPEAAQLLAEGARGLRRITDEL